MRSTAARFLTCRPSGCRRRRRRTSAALLRTDPPRSSPAGDSDLPGNNKKKNNQSQYRHAYFRYKAKSRVLSQHFTCFLMNEVQLLNLFHYFNIQTKEATTTIMFPDLTMAYSIKRSRVTLHIEFWTVWTLWNRETKQMITFEKLKTDISFTSCLSSLQRTMSVSHSSSGRWIFSLTILFQCFYFERGRHADLYVSSRHEEFI